MVLSLSVQDYNEDLINSRVMRCCLGAQGEVGGFEKVAFINRGLFICFKDRDGYSVLKF